MLTTNMNLNQNRLVNSLVVKVIGFKSTYSTVKVIYVTFNDENAGKTAIQLDNIAWKNCWAPI